MQNKRFHFAFNFLCVFDLSFKKKKKNTTKQTEKQKNQHRQDRSTAGRPSGGKLLGTEAAWKRQTEKKRSEICPWRAQTLTKWDRRGCELNSEEGKKKKMHKACWDLQMKRREKLNAQVLWYTASSPSRTHADEFITNTWENLHYYSEKRSDLEKHKTRGQPKKKNKKKPHTHSTSLFVCSRHMWLLSGWNTEMKVVQRAFPSPPLTVLPVHMWLYECVFMRFRSYFFFLRVKK